MLMIRPAARLVLAAVAAAACVAASASGPDTKPVDSRLSASVVERGLVSKSPSVDEILREHDKVAVSSTRVLKGAALGYVTPWNSLGYEVALRFANKFTHLSPVWLQLKIDEPGDDRFVVRMAGLHDVREEWLARVRALPQPPKILPRVNFEVRQEAFVKIASSSALQKKIVSELINVIERWGFDGLVLELTYAWAIVQNLAPEKRSKLNRFVRRIGDELHALSPRREMVLVVAPYAPSSPLFAHEDLLEVHDAVDWLSLMTYDYSTAQRPGPSAPLGWMEKSVKALLGETFALGGPVAAKVLLGLNFYGQDFGGGKAEVVVGRTFLETLRKHSPSVVWESKHHEHRFIYRTLSPANQLEEHSVYFPTLLSLSDRVALANRLGCGVSVWELGQGLDYFGELL